MRSRFHGMAVGAIALLLAMAPLSSLAGLPLAAGQADSGSYESPQFGYVVEWNDDWAERERETASDEGGLDSMVISNNDGRVQVAGRADDLDADEFLDEIATLVTGDADDVEVEVEVVAEDRDGDVPTVELTTDRDHLLLEAHTVDGAVVVVALRAREADYEAALADAQAGITLNGMPVLSGEAAAPEGNPVDPTEEPTGEPGGTGIDGTSYTSPNHGFSVRWDEAWDATETTGTGDFDELRLTGSTGGVSILAGSFYGGDPETCLAGEDTYFGAEDPNVEDWALAVDAGGEAVTGGSDGVAYGVFTFTYVDDEDGDLELVDYIECRALVPGETTLEILASSTPDLYEEHIAAVLEITNAIEMPAGSAPIEPSDPAPPVFEGQAAPAATPEAVASPAAGGESGFDGSTFTSASFGFTLQVPEGWTVEDEAIAAGDETLVVSNGLSTVSVHATDDYTGDLTGCIVFARNLLEADPLYADLRLDATASGEAFQGVDDARAFARFTYTGADGGKWAHFVNCEPIVAGESVLIVSQDVPYDDYTAERSARRQIQGAIEFP